MKEVLKLEAEEREERWEKNVFGAKILTDETLKNSLEIYKLICEK